MQTMTHAQLKFQRRILNAKGRHPAFGAPILGPLSPIEAEHKVRRRARRKVLVEARIKECESHLMKVQVDLEKRHEKNIPPEEVKALEEKERLLDVYRNNEIERLRRLR